MNAFDDLIQAAKDMDFHGADYYSAPSIEARERAKKASRKLFPPMAKALAWETAQGVMMAKLYCVCHLPDCKAWEAIHAQEIMQFFNSEAEAKAACEAHHQAQFLELLA